MSQAQSPEPRKIIAETRLIPGGAPDVKLQLINKRPDDLRRFSPERTLVMMNIDEMLDEVVRLIRDASGSLGQFVDLGIGTGSLAERVLKAIPEAQVIVGKKQSSPSPQESHERRIDELIAG